MEEGARPDAFRPVVNLTVRKPGPFERLSLSFGEITLKMRDEKVLSCILKELGLETGTRVFSADLMRQYALACR
jgi:hypothetical protein